MLDKKKLSHYALKILDAFMCLLHNGYIACVQPFHCTCNASSISFLWSMGFGCGFQRGHIRFPASLVAAAEAALVALSELEVGQMQPAEPPIAVATVINILGCSVDQSFHLRFQPPPCLTHSPVLSRDSKSCWSIRSKGWQYKCIMNYT